MRSDIQVPLSKGWPHRIRSGVIHVISLAHFSLTFARSVAANSINARIRLKAENSRLRQEISILDEVRCRRLSVRLEATAASIRCDISGVRAFSDSLNSRPVRGLETELPSSQLTAW